MHDRDIRISEIWCLLTSEMSLWIHKSLSGVHKNKMGFHTYVMKPSSLKKQQRFSRYRVHCLRRGLKTGLLVSLLFQLLMYTISLMFKVYPKQVLPSPAIQCNCYLFFTLAFGERAKEEEANRKRMYLIMMHKHTYIHEGIHIYIYSTVQHHIGSHTRMLSS